MPRVMLTDRLIKSLKPTTTRVEYHDALVPALVLRVMPTGVKTWALRYRHRGRPLRLTLDSIDHLSLADARDRARKELLAINNGADPARAKRDARQAETIEDLATLYIEKWAKPRKRSWKQDDNLLRTKVLPRWRTRAIVDIKRRDVRALVEDVAEAGAPIVANRVAALLSKMFAVALDRELVEVSPAMRIPRPGQETARDRVYTEDELRTLWHEFEALPTPMAAFFKLRLLTAQRGNEVTNMRWQDLDLTTGWWTIPATGTKNKLPHRVPLSAPVLALIESLRSAKMHETYVLGAAHRAEGIGARGKRQQADAAATFTVRDFHGHDLRRTAASFMTSGGISRLVVAKVLNHKEHGVTAVYDRHSYDAEKHTALVWWAAHLLDVVERRPRAVA